MRYKALMLDVDGTIIPYDFAALPSQKVIDSLLLAQEKLKVFLVTGRSFYSTKPIIDKIGLTGSYAVVDNGAYVIDTRNENIIYEKLIEESDLEKIKQVLLDEKVNFYIKDKFTLLNKHDYLPYKKGDKLKDVSMIFTYEEFTQEKTESILKKLSLPNLKAFNNRHKDPDKFGINFTHAEATKLHGINEVIKRLNIPKEEIIGAGDGYNDFPLLMASGLKVAMGNAIDDLKEIADYIAPSVDDDGVTEIVNKFILS